MNAPLNHFDRGKPFYPLVMSYVIQLLGFKELAVRGFMGPRDIRREDLQMVKHVQFNTTDQAAITSDLEILRKLSGPLELRSEFQGDRIIVDADNIAQELSGADHEYILSFYIRAAGSIIILAHEVTKDAPYRDTGSLWEFLRHCRNAATHNGLFHFNHGEPRRPAEWGQFRIETGLQGTPLFKDATGQGLLSPGDPIRLLWDIEQAYPAMQV